jgi:hypothetical protein
MKALFNLSALCLSVVLGLLPFAVIAVDGSAAMTEMTQSAR